MRVSAVLVRSARCGVVWFAPVIPPGRASRGDWQWWIAAVIALVSAAAVAIGLTLLIV